LLILLNLLILYQSHKRRFNIRMKIVHICLEAPYIDGWAYQENILPSCHAELGHEVTVIASSNAMPYYVKHKVKNMITPYQYLNNNIKIIRIKRKWSIFNKLNYYNELPNVLQYEKPDLLYLHGGQSLSILALKKYIKNHPKTKLVVDFHGEYYNTALNIFSRQILHKIIWRSIIQNAMTYITKIYCISPSVKKFTEKMYNIPSKKIEYLYLGTIINEKMISERSKIKERIRMQLGIKANAFLLVTGGKLNQDKRLDILAKAIKTLNDENIHLVIFGLSDPQEPDFAYKIFRDVNKVHFVGWCDYDMILQYYLASDLAVFPGGQSALWQHAIGAGLPAIFRKWPGNEYLNKGNAIFLYSDNSDELAQWIAFLSKGNSELLKEMRVNAFALAINELSYMNEAIRICSVMGESY